jgi:hypothetical protein
LTIVFFGDFIVHIRELIVQSDVVFFGYENVVNAEQMVTVQFLVVHKWASDVVVSADGFDSVVNHAGTCADNHVHHPFAYQVSNQSTHARGNNSA